MSSKSGSTKIEILKRDNKVNWPLLSLGIIVIVLITLVLLRILSAEVATAIFAGVSPLIAFRQAIYSSRQAEKASQQTRQALTANVLFRLYELYSSRRMHRAIEEVWGVVKQEGNGVSTFIEFLEKPDRYRFLEEYVDKLDLVGEWKRLNESRRIVTHFWYLIANLLAEDMLSVEDTFTWFGPPDVIWVLEGLESVQQKRAATGGMRKTLWPPLQILERYYRLKGVSVKALDKAEVPIGRIDLDTLSQIRNCKLC